MYTVGVWKNDALCAEEFCALVDVYACAVAWINELWSDPQSAACSFSIIELEGEQPIMLVRGGDCSCS
jgi:hypothetical protein